MRTTSQHYSCKTSHSFTVVC